MLYSIENREDLESLNELISLQGEVNVLQDKLGKQNFHEDMKKVLEPVTKAIKDVSQDKTRTITESSIENNKAPENLNIKLLEIMNGRGILASYLLSPLCKISNPEYISQFELVKDPGSNRVNDLLVNKTIPGTVYNILLTFSDTEKKFDLQDLLKMITNKNYNVDLAKLSDKKIIYEFTKEMYFGEKALGNKSATDKSLIRLFKSTAIMASGISTIFLPDNPNELCDRIKLLQQEKQAGNNTNRINEEIVAIADKLLEYKCISTKQHKFLLLNCLNWMKTMK